MDLYLALEGRQFIKRCLSPKNKFSFPTHQPFTEKLSLEITPVFQLGHSGYIVRMEFASDGKQLATMDDTGVLKLWDAVTGRLLHNILGAQNASLESDELFKFTPDGHGLLLPSPQSGFVVYDTLTGKLLRKLERSKLLSATVIDKNIFAFISTSDGMRLVDVVSNKETVHLRWPNKGTNIFGPPIISPDGKRVVAFNSQNNFVLWDTETGQVLKECFIPAKKSLIDWVVSGDFNVIAFQAEQNSLRILDLVSGEINSNFGKEHVVDRFWIDHSGQRLALHLDFKIMVRKVSSGQILFEMDDTSMAEEAAVCFSDDGSILVAWSEGNEVYTAEMTERVRLWHAPPAPFSPFGYKFCFDSSGEKFLRSSAEMIEEDFDIKQHLTLWCVQELKPECSFLMAPSGLLGVESCLDGETFLYVEGGMATRRLWSDGQIRNTTELGHYSINDVILSPDGKELFWIDDGNKPVALNLLLDDKSEEFRPSFWDSFLSCLFRSKRKRALSGSDPNPLLKLFDGAGSHLLALSVPNNLLITFSKHTGLCLWSLTSRRCLKRSWIKGVNPLSLVASPDGEMLAIGTANTIEIFQLPELTHLFSFLEHGNSITTLDFSPDSKLLASGGADSAIRIWSLHDRDKIHELNGHLSPLEAIKFSPSGDLLVSASNDATFRFWDTNSGDLLKTVLDLSPTSYVILSPDGSFHATPDAEDYLSFTVVGDEECRNLTVDEFEDKYEKGWRKSKEILKR